MVGLSLSMEDVKGGDVQLQLKCSFTTEREMNILKLYIDTANIIFGNSQTIAIHH